MTQLDINKVANEDETFKNKFKETSQKISSQYCDKNNSNKIFEFPDITFPFILFILKVPVTV